MNKVIYYFLISFSLFNSYGQNNGVNPYQIGLLTRTDLLKDSIFCSVHNLVIDSDSLMLFEGGTIFYFDADIYELTLRFVQDTLCYISSILNNPKDKDYFLEDIKKDVILETGKAPEVIELSDTSTSYFWNIYDDNNNSHYTIDLFIDEAYDNRPHLLIKDLPKSPD